jgi:hypothetical protein
MVQRFLHEVPWEETELFTNHFAHNLTKEGRAKKYASLAQLVRHYEQRYGPLFRSLQSRGLVIPTWKDPQATFLYVHIGRTGEIIWTRDGNHRLGMVLALGLQRIPVRVLSRHAGWQRRRDDLSRGLGSEGGPQLDHPDFDDLRFGSAHQAVAH